MGRKKVERQYLRMTPAGIEELKQKGFNQSQIAEIYGVSRQAVSWQKITYGGSVTTRQEVDKAWPWPTNSDHSRSRAYKSLRDHGEYMATGGEGMSFEKLQRLRSWWKRLKDENIVLEFDPNIPPTPGVSKRAGGFAYRPRVASDGDLLIRVNEYTELTEEGRRIWCWPT